MKTKLILILAFLLCNILSVAKATNVGGIINSDTRWTVDGSPYVLTSNVQIAEEARLTVEPGVEINGNHYRLEIWGSVNMAGTESSIIILDDIFIWGRGDASTITIIYCDADAMKIRAYGDTLAVRNSTIRNYYDESQGIHISNGDSHSYIEKNVFINAVDIDVAAVNTFIHNNVFFEQVLGEAIISSDVSPSVKYNSFLSTDKIAVKIQNSGSMTAVDNYWNTTDIDIIGSMIYDRSDDLAVSNYIPYLPILNEPHPDTPYYAMAGTWSELNMPGLDRVVLLGIGSNMIVGQHGQDPAHGLVYEMTTGFYYTLDKPGAGKLGTTIRDVDGDNVIGSYYDTRWHGFVYNLSEQDWTTIDVPGNTSMQLHGIDGDNVVGYYHDGSWRGFVYSLTTGDYTTLDGLGPNTYVKGISGKRIVGYYKDGGWHGFIYDMSTHIWSTLDAPGASDTIVSGIDGDDIVGYYNGSRNFLYNVATQTWSTIYSKEGSDNIFPENIHSDNVIFGIGEYGSVYTMSGELPIVPECFAPIQGDVNGDCKVDFADFAVMASNWLACNWQPPTACW